MIKRPFLRVNSNYLKHYNRFRKLYFRIRILIREGLFFHLSSFERNRLLNRFKLFYKRLFRLQSKSGIKFAGTTLVFTLIYSLASSQVKFIEKTGEENPLGGKINPFSHLNMGEKIAPAFVDTEILDISGGILLIERFDNVRKDSIIKISVSSLSKGIYYISINRGKNVVNKKFIVN